MSFKNSIKNIDGRKFDKRLFNEMAVFDSFTPVQKAICIVLFKFRSEMRKNESQ